MTSANTKLGSVLRDKDALNGCLSPLLSHLGRSSSDSRSAQVDGFDGLFVLLTQLI